MIKIDKDSYDVLIIVYLFCAAAIFALFRFVGIWWLCWPLTAGLIWVCGWQTMFHRVPKRNKIGNDKIVSAVTDGKVVIIEKTFEPEYLKTECIQVSIYMDFWDVHANFWPIDGEVVYEQYHRGKHFFAYKPKSSTLNEHWCIGVRNDQGTELMFKQIAGGFARRIVNYAKPGLRTEAGEQCGIIKFGSRIDYFLPLDAEIKVELGDKVRACESIIANIK